ncbi:MAG: Scr1 family TA system antitoxin-like transcriptional regulator, partial [Streptosporangiaceae bacterium]
VITKAESGDRPPTVDVIDALVAARMERQAILDRDDPPDIVAVVEGAALHRLIGSPQVMHDSRPDRSPRRVARLHR